MQEEFSILGRLTLFEINARIRQESRMIERWQGTMEKIEKLTEMLRESNNIVFLVEPG